MLPEMIKIRQKFNRDEITNVGEAVSLELNRLGIKITKGSKIAITAGSRGIDRIPEVIRAVVQFIRSMGAEPFIVPAMGSHGGATAEGQVGILKELGISPETVGAPIFSSMEVVEIGSILSPLSGCLPVVMDKYTYNADGIIVVNRIKPHTSFHADVESGLMKMMVIGLGKAIQAGNIHRFGTKGLRELIVPAARCMLESGKILAGLGIVENSYDRIMNIKGFLPGEIEAGEKELLDVARKCLPGLPVDELDILIVEQIGKNISGTGMDTNVIGRLKIQGENEPEKPVIKRIIALDLTDETNGNAYGIGLADFTTKKLADKINHAAMYANAITTGFVERAKIPVICADENEAIMLAVQSCGIRDVSGIRAARIRSTLNVEELRVSPSVYEEIKDKVETVS